MTLYLQPETGLSSRRRPAERTLTLTLTLTQTLTLTLGPLDCDYDEASNRLEAI